MFPLVFGLGISRQVLRTEGEGKAIGTTDVINFYFHPYKLHCNLFPFTEAHISFTGIRLRLKLHPNQLK